MVRLFRQAENDKKVRLFLKWQPYGLAFFKPILYQHFHGRPVLYLNDSEYHEMLVSNGIEASFAWRVVRFDYSNTEEAFDFTHEREWRTPNDVVFSSLEGDNRPLAIVNAPTERDELLAVFPPEPNCPFRGIVCLQDTRVLG